LAAPVYGQTDAAKRIDCQVIAIVLFCVGLSEPRAWGVGDVGITEVVPDGDTGVGVGMGRRKDLCEGV
jgi:hypothetical protein